jgi:hypothetical protein
MENKKIKLPGRFIHDKIIVNSTNKIIMDVIIILIKTNLDIAY